MTDIATVRRVVITIPLAPSPALAPNRIGHEHWRIRGEAVKELREAAWAVACGMVTDGCEVLCATFTRPVHVHEHIVWPKGKRLKDPDALATYCKPALDGIVDAGIIPDDSARYIASITTSQAMGQDAHGMIEITLTDATPSPDAAGREMR